MKSGSVLANITWAALDLSDALRGWGVVAATLVIEFLVLLRAFPLPWRRAALATLVMNVVSGVFGLYVLPLLGFAWSAGPARSLGFSEYGWANLALLFGAALIGNVVLETLAVALIGVTVDRRRVGWLALANAVTVAIWFAATFLP